MDFHGFFCFTPVNFDDLFHGMMWCHLLIWEGGGDFLGAAMRKQPPRRHLEFLFFF